MDECREEKAVWYDRKVQKLLLLVEKCKHQHVVS